MTKFGHSNNSLDVMMILQTICLCINFRVLRPLDRSLLILFRLVYFPHVICQKLLKFIFNCVHLIFER